MSFFLARPLCLILIFVGIPLYLYWKKSLTGDPVWRGGMILLLRSAVVFLLVMALAGPIVTWRNYTKFVVFAVDGSGSVADGKKAERFIAEAVAAQGKNESVTLFFAGDVSVDAEQCDPSATNLASALTASAALAPEDYVPRVVLFSDGTYTRGAVPAKVSDAVPLDVVFLPTLPKDGTQEMWIERVTAPRTGYEGQVVGVDVFIRAQGVGNAVSFFKEEINGKVLIGTRGSGVAGEKSVAQGNIQLLRNGEPVETQAVTFEKDGVRGVRFQTAVTKTTKKTENSLPEAVRWSVKLSPAEENQDVCTVNNTADAFTQVIPHERILLVQRTPDLGRMIRETLKKQFVEVESCTADEIPRTRQEFGKYGLVMFSNIPREKIPQASLVSLRDYVTQDGGGLVMIGGDQSFTSGGYQETPLEELLPVICKESREKTRKGLALMLVVDRSGSMDKGNAIGLARQAVKKAVEQLLPQDQVGVLAYAQEVNTKMVVDIQPVTKENKAAAFQEIDRLAAEGQTEMAQAMEKAYAALKEVSADRKHIILMSDGVSSPGDFAGIAQKIRDAGITVSTVALGAEAEPNLLADIAAIGGGSAYFCTDAVEMPDIFSRETAAAVAKLGIIEGQTPLRQISSIPGFMNFDFTQVPPLLGYVQTRAKAESRVIFESPNQDPILAWWKCGRGKTVAFMSDMESHWVETWHSGWADFDRFWARLINHAIRKNQAEDFHLAVTCEDEWMRVSLVVPPEISLKSAVKMRLQEVVEQGGAPVEMTLPNVAPGLYAGRVKVNRGTRYDLTLTAGEEYSWRMSAYVNFPEEYRPDRQKPASEILTEISRETGGKINPQPAEIFAKNQGTAGENELYVAQTLPFWRFLVFFALCAWMGEIFMRRSPVVGQILGK